ncbi:MAG: VPDSG-CTERM sorting domain-containing protein [Verrucomicrobia bacterium]|nr:VPDSG-CTERM sorting domain-containing protein [Verrucomicrobiota bacterium]
MSVAILLSAPVWSHAIEVSIFHVGDSGTVNGAIFTGDEQHVGGTGNFNPFLSLQEFPIERAYNAGNGNLYMDNTRPSWNSQLRVGDLQQVTVGDLDYFLFVLDANEPGNNKSFISIDNIRIYTSSEDTSLTVQGDEGMLDSLGTLRYAMNDPLRDIDGDYIISDWVNLDSRLDDEPAGSGLHDLLVYVPVSNFAGAADTDYLWFYNLNGVHEKADDDLASEAGFEEWRVLMGSTPNHETPDTSATAMLLGIALLGLAGLRRRLAPAA